MPYSIQEHRYGAWSPLVHGPLKSVTRVHCDTRPTVTLPAAERHCPLASTKLYCLVESIRV